MHTPPTRRQAETTLIQKRNSHFASRVIASAKVVVAPGHYVYHTSIVITIKRSIARIHTAVYIPMSVIVIADVSSRTTTTAPAFHKLTNTTITLIILVTLVQVAVVGDSTPLVLFLTTCAGIQSTLFWKRLVLHLHLHLPPIRYRVLQCSVKNTQSLSCLCFSSSSSTTCQQLQSNCCYSKNMEEVSPFPCTSPTMCRLRKRMKIIIFILIICLSVRSHDSV